MPEVLGTITSPGDRQGRVVELQAGVRYYIEVEGSDTGAGTMSDPNLELWTMFYEPLINEWLEGHLLYSDSDSGVGENARLYYTPSVTSHFVVWAGGDRGSTGSYRMRVFEDDFRNSIEGTGLVGPHGGTAPIGGKLNYVGDSDFSQSLLIGGLTYTIDMRGQATGDGTLGDPYLRLYNFTGALLGSDDDAGTGNNARLAFTAPATAGYWIEARSYADGYSGSFELSIGQGTGSTGADDITGTYLADAVNGARGNDTINGQAANDLLLGGKGNDWLFGGTESDTLRGQDGNDNFEPGGGIALDVVIGGRGNDTFHFSDGTSRVRLAAGDGVGAFEGAGTAEGDRIDLWWIDADTTTPDVNEAFVFGSPGKGHLWVINNGGNSIVRGNTDGDGVIEFELVIADGAVQAAAYRGADFVL